MRQRLIGALVCSTVMLPQLNLHAQRLVTLQHNGASTFFRSSTPLQDAYTAAVNGDTIIVPGGTFTCPIISKSIVLLGEGFRADSTMVNGPSVINSNVVFNTGADGSHLEGFRILGGVITNQDQRVDNLVIRRNEMQSFSANASYQTNRCESVLFTENVIHGDVYCFNLFNSTISNNIIGSGISQAHDLLVRNNVFLNYGPYTGWPDYVQANLIACQNTVFSNNIFMAAGYSVLSSSVTNCSFLNNVYCNTPNYYTNNTEVGNYPAQDPNTIFVNNAGGTTYSLLSDYHLQNPALYIGDDGTQCGLYGGFHPFKDGSVPFHPHWIQATVDQFTNQATGEINVNFKVSSQNQ